MYLYLTDHAPCRSAGTFFALLIPHALVPRLASIVVHSMQEDNRLRASHLLVLKVFAIILHF